MYLEFRLRLGSAGFRVLVLGLDERRMNLSNLGFVSRVFKFEESGVSLSSSERKNV